MANWVVVTTEDNFEKMCELKAVGLSAARAKTAAQAVKGDRLIFYVSQKRADKPSPNRRVCSFVAVGTVQGRPFETDTGPWTTAEGQSFPIHLKCTVRKGKRRIRADELVEKLEFVKNKDKWGSAFLSSFRGVSDEDYEVVEGGLMGARE